MRRPDVSDLSASIMQGNTAHIYVAPTARLGPVPQVVVKASRPSIVWRASVDTKAKISSVEANGATAAASTANAIVASDSVALESARVVIAQSSSLHHLDSQAIRPVTRRFQQRLFLAASALTAHVVAKMDTNAKDTLAVNVAAATAFAAT